MNIVWILLVVLLIVGACGLWRVFCDYLANRPDDDDDDEPRFI